MRYTICTKCDAVVSMMTYRCPSCQRVLNALKVSRVKLCRHDGTPIPIGRRFCSTCGLPVTGKRISGWGWFWLVIAASIVTTALLTGIHHLVYISYQQDSCVVDNGLINSSTDQGGSIYQPEFDYHVVNDKQQVIDSRRGNFGLGTFYSEDEARQVLNEYPAGSSHVCWYSPISISGTVFELPKEDVSSYQLIWFFCDGISIALILWAFVMLVLHPNYLHHRGRAATGVIVGYMERTDEHGVVTGTSSIIEYETGTTPGLRCRALLPRKESLGKQVAIFYDFLNPARNRIIGASYRRDKMVSRMTGGYVLLLILFIAPALLTLLAFSL